MRQVRALLAVEGLFALVVASVCIIIYSIWPRVFVWESYCDWDLTAQTWEDVNSNGIRDGDEPPLENAAISYGEIRSGRTDDIPRVSGFDEDGKVVLLSRGIGVCPERVQVKAFAPDGYIPTTSDQTTVAYKLTTSIGFGFRREPDSKPTVPLTGTAQCKHDSFRLSGTVTGLEFARNGDTWATSQPARELIFRRDGKDYSQDIEDLGGFADDIAQSPDGTIWVAGGGNTGVAHFNGTSWKLYTTVYGALPSNDVNGIKVTPDGHVWALTSVGPADFNPVSGRWRNYSDIGNGFLLLSAPDNVLWVVSENALIRFQSQSPRDTARRIPIALGPVTYLHIWNGIIAEDGSVWLIGFADTWPIIAHYEPSTDRWTKYTYLTTHGSMPFYRFGDAGVLPDGSVLLGAGNRGVIRLIPNDSPENSQWMTFPSITQYVREGASDPSRYRNLAVLLTKSMDNIWFSDDAHGGVLMCNLQQ